METHWHYFKKPAPNEVHIWQVSPNDYLPGELVPSELLRLKKITSKTGQKEFKAMRKALRYLTSCYLSLPPEELLFEKGHHGKPYIVGAPELSFSLTHCKEVLLLAFGHHSIGLDLEVIRPVNIMGIAARFFHDEECAMLNALPLKEREERFFQLWVAKEATLKADGCGIAHGIKKTLSHFEKDQLQSVVLDQKKWFLHQWSFSEKGYHFIGGLATSFPSPIIEWHNFHAEFTVARAL